MGSVLNGTTPVSVWGRLQRRVVLVDLFLGVLLGVLSVLVGLELRDVITEPLMARPDNLLRWALVVGPAWAVPFRRTAPTAAVVGGGLIQAALWTANLPDTYLTMAVLLYSSAAHGSERSRRSGWAVAVLLTVYTLVGVLTDGAPFYALPVVGLFSIAAVALGAAAFNRQAYAEAAETRAEELVRSRQADRDRALVEERARIARELHDVVAHGLSVIVVQAAAAQRILDRDPPGAASALQQIEQTGRNALSEMRQVLSAIRTEPDESWQPAPGLGAIDGLVSELAATGLTVTVERSPDRSSDSTSAPLPATVDVTAYRIVQESLTNVLKHGGDGAEATVRIDRKPDSLDLLIVDDGRGRSATDHGGHGLRGMQERVEVFGGTLSAGPRPGRGFQVRVSLPLDPIAHRLDTRPRTEDEGAADKTAGGQAQPADGGDRIP